MPRQKTAVDHEALGLVLDAMKAGATLREACAKPGAPSWHLVNEWRRADPSVDWYVRLLAHRTPPGASEHLAKLVEEGRAEWNIRRWRGGGLPQWPDYEPRLRRMERDAAVRFAEPPPAAPVDPANPETCF